MKIILLTSRRGKGLKPNTCWRIPFVHISTGDLLREAVKNKTILGLKAKSFMDAGNLVLMMCCWFDWRSAHVRRGEGKFYLDGFPRTLPQASALDVLFEKLVSGSTVSSSLEVNNEEIIDRLNQRRLCRAVDASILLLVLVPILKYVPVRCEVYQRDDDKPEPVRRRLEVYQQQTKPLIDYYRKTNRLVPINGMDEIVTCINCTRRPL